MRARRGDLDAATLYQMFVEDSVENDLPVDALEQFLDMPGKGAARNDQSIVLKLGKGAEAVLLTGDMQLADSEVPELDDHMTALLEACAEAGPYAFVKIPHHASENAFDKTVLDALAKTKAFGISTGRGDRRHPNPKVLTLLKKNKKTINWARTDKNGIVTVTFAKDGKANFEIKQGKLDDFSPNSAVDVSRPEAETAPASQALQPLAPPPPEQVAISVGPATDCVEIVARIPHVTTRVTIAVSVEPGMGGTAPAGATLARSDPQQRQMAPGRSNLLFVTASERLGNNIGRTEAAAAIRAIRDAGLEVFEVRSPTHPSRRSHAPPKARKGWSSWAGTMSCRRNATTCCPPTCAVWWAIAAAIPTISWCGAIRVMATPTATALATSRSRVFRTAARPTWSGPCSRSTRGRRACGASACATTRARSLSISSTTGCLLAVVACW